MRRLVCTLGLILLSRAANAQASEALWYLVDDENSIRSFVAHADQISIVSPQTFFLDSLGVLWGSVDPRVTATARAKKVKLIPLVMNPGFDQPGFHRVLVTPDIRLRAIRAMTALCRDNKFDGLQFDFENILVSDRDAFTSFARETADSLHRIGCSLSAAVVPRTSDFPGPSQYHRWIYEYWRGAYDYKALADALDFISYMTYAQHTGGTTPGPVAGFTWMEAGLKYVLSLGVPASKISLGIPAYSDAWHSGYDTRAAAPRVQGSDISYNRAMELLARHSVTPLWDDREKVTYAFWSNDGLYEFAFIEDARAFAAKRALADRYKLRGYSVWVLGLEDPRVWDRAR